MKTWTVECAEPGCDRTVPALVADLRWTCPAHSIACWPDSDRPCDRDADCGSSCYLDEDNGFVYEGQRGGNGDPVEDVMFECRCEHHIGPSAGARHAEARRGAAAMRSLSFASIRLWP